MKVIGSVKEDLNLEKRNSISPETVKKFIDLNFSILLEKNYGTHIGIADDKYKSKGVILDGKQGNIVIPNLNMSEFTIKFYFKPSNFSVSRVKNNLSSHKNYLTF